MADAGLICLSFDPVRHPGAVAAAEKVLGAALPGFGRLQHGALCMLRSAPCDWLILAPALEVPALVARLAAQLSAFPAIVSDVSDGYLLLRGIDPERLGALSAVMFAEGEAKAVRLRQVRALAFVRDGEATVIVARSYRGIPGLGEGA